MRIARRVRSQHRFSFDGQDTDVVRLPPAAVTRLIQQLASTVTSSVHQIVPLAPRFEAADAFSDTVWRSLAEDEERNVQVKRLHLLPSGRGDQDLADPRDESPRYEVRGLPIQQLIDEEPAALPLSNVWLIDGTTVVTQEPQGSPFWQVSTRTADVERFREMWNRLWSRAETTWESVPAGLDLTEQLVLSADTMATIAPFSCIQPTDGRSTCSWYHGVWQHLRLFNMVSSPDWHSPFYEHALDQAFHGLAGEKQPRVLITGTADYTLLAYVLRAAANARADAGITVVDRCRTALLSCQWYSQRWATQEALGTCTVDVREADVLEIAPDPVRYHLITTDGFLTRLETSTAKEVIRSWHELLEPGGTVITTVRVHPLDAPRGSVLDEVSDFALRARDRAQRWRRYLKSRVNDITSAAQQYALSMRSQDLGDAATIGRLFAEQGFKIRYSSLNSVPGELRPATYIQIIAGKL
ncbi:hypothetical protein [Actinomadura sp. DC4]|uniref:hypothetical protein n=1 Tax=Actinomadura sp. DC4 TaxID=3055069 RepID=UPI0025B17F1E|nr:hypothetical protein [Actinomadura sp. DC4]MDN3351646.1 hypothetical protein [Actinomadura sp. DC4]